MKKKCNQRNKIQNKCCCSFCNNSIEFDINTNFGRSRSGRYCLLQDMPVSKGSFCLEFENKENK